MIKNLRKKLANFIYKEQVTEKVPALSKEEALDRWLSNLPTAERTYLPKLLSDNNFKDIIARNDIGCQEIPVDTRETDEKVFVSIHSDLFKGVRASYSFNKEVFKELEENNIKMTFSVLAVRFGLHSEELRPIKQIGEMLVPGIVFRMSDYPEVLAKYGVHYSFVSSETKVFIPMMHRVLKRPSLGIARFKDRWWV